VEERRLSACVQYGPGSAVKSLQISLHGYINLSDDNFDKDVLGGKSHDEVNNLTDPYNSYDIPYFSPELIVISEEAGHEKPAPEIYMKALSAAGTAAEHALFVGDSWSNDVVGPGRVGLRAVWFNKRGGQAAPQSNLAGVISRLEELEAYL
jgi:phosphoglycolate phosphatase-like HAD superfamily hydrolase